MDNKWLIVLVIVSWSISCCFFAVHVLYFHSDSNNCHHVYLDLGTNRGIQIRKVFEPHLYPGAPALEIFNRYFDPERSGVCVFGFEPNPIHSRELKRLQKAYQEKGWFVKIFHVAASNKEGTVKFKRDVALGTEKAEWAARIIKDEEEEGEILPQHLFVGDDPVIQVPAINFADWFVDQAFPQDAVIVAKTDMEFHDNVVWANMIQRGLICRIAAIYGEHVEGLDHVLSYLRQHGKNCTTQLIAKDDETYGMSKFPFP